MGVCVRTSDECPAPSLQAYIFLPIIPPRVGGGGRTWVSVCIGTSICPQSRGTPLPQSSTCASHLGHVGDRVGRGRECGSGA